MKLREVALPGRFAVYAVELPESGCQVETFMLTYQLSHPRAIQNLNALLCRHVPMNGPPFENGELAKRLRDNVCEFKGREPRSADRQPRVLFFQDERWIVCTNAFMKPVPGTTDEGEIERCLDLRKEFLLMKARREAIQIAKGWAL